jgi:Protein of unknown function (DUF1254)
VNGHLLRAQRESRSSSPKTLLAVAVTGADSPPWVRTPHLVYDLEEVASGVEGGGSLPMQAPYNNFAYARRLLGPETKFVSPNNDTLYVVGQCGVRQGPLVLHVPDTHDRYYVLQFIDAWTNNFAYIGRRATGIAEAEYLLTDRDYKGPVPDGMTIVDAPTGVFTIGGRVQVDGEGDLPAVHALQDQFTLSPLSVYQGDAAQDRGAGQGQRRRAGRLEQRPAPVRLQPGPPGPWHHRCARVEDPRPGQGLRSTGSCGTRRAVGQPRL